MQNGIEQQSGEEAPLYVRWNPDRSPYAIELRLDLVDEVSDELARAERLGAEIGGVLVGTFPTAYSPTLRIEDVEIVERGAEEGAIYVLDPGKHERVTEIRSRARARQRDAVGFFRSHLRPGAMQPSLADRSLLSREFRDGLYAVLLIEGRAPHTATFFLASNGHLPGEASVRNFRFDEREFRALPEVQPEAGPPLATKDAEDPKPRSGAKVYGTVAALLVIAVVACFFMWSFSRQTPVPHAAEASTPLRLALENRGGLLRITWDHGSHDLDRATGATVEIVDGPSRRDLQLGVDELRLGAIEYERNTGKVQVKMSVNAPSTRPGAGPSQTAQWP